MLATRQVWRSLRRRLRPLKRSLQPPDVWTWLKTTQRIRTVIDVGANDGAYGRFLAEFFGAEATYAFEPQSSCREALQRVQSSTKGYTWFPLALGCEDGDAEFFVNDFHPASSLLPTSQISHDEFPQTTNQRVERVPVTTLDGALADFPLHDNLLVKMDVQGVEDRVLRGGPRIFARAQCVAIEMSFVPIYESQPLFEEVHELLAGYGLRFAGFKNQVCSERTGQPLFTHCFYVRPDGTADSSGKGTSA